VTAVTTILPRLEEANRKRMKRKEYGGEDEERELSGMSGLKDCLSSSALAMLVPGLVIDNRRRRGVSFVFRIPFLYAPLERQVACMLVLSFVTDEPMTRRVADKHPCLDRNLGCG